AFIYLPLVFMPEADSLKHPQQSYLTLPLQQTVFARYGNSHIGRKRFAVTAELSRIAAGA
ncbi:hypothetical protein F7F89_28605, partial [Escherichia coli]